MRLASGIQFRIYRPDTDPWYTNMLCRHVPFIWVLALPGRVIFSIRCFLNTDHRHDGLDNANIKEMFLILYSDDKNELKSVGLHSGLDICLFNDSISCSDYMMSNEKIVNN
jgi:hypothetical protein